MKNRKQFLSVLLSGFLAIGTLQGPFFASSALQVTAEARMAAADAEEGIPVILDENEAVEASSMEEMAQEEADAGSAEPTVEGEEISGQEDSSRDRDADYMDPSSDNTVEEGSDLSAADSMEDDGAEEASAGEDDGAEDASDREDNGAEGLSAGESDGAEDVSAGEDDGTEDASAGEDMEETTLPAEEEEAGSVIVGQEDAAETDTAQPSEDTVQTPAVNAGENETCTVTVNANGGSIVFYEWDENDELIEHKFSDYSFEWDVNTWGNWDDEFEIIPPEGKALAGWSYDPNTSPEDEMYLILPDAEHTFYQDCTLYAIYEDYAARFTTITFDANGGFFPEFVTVEEEYGSISDDRKVLTFTYDWTKSYATHAMDRYVKTKRTDQALAGWSLTKGGKAVFETQISEEELEQVLAPKRDCTLYAVWSNAKVLTLRAEGGIFGNAGTGMWDDLQNDMVAYKDTLSVKYPAGEVLYDYILSDDYRPTRAGYTFQGYSLKKGGTALEEYTVTGNATLYALWKEDSSYEKITEINLSDTELVLDPRDWEDKEIYGIGEVYAYGRIEVTMQSDWWNHRLYLWERNIRWESSNPTVATIETSNQTFNFYIRIYAKGPGTTTITGTALDGSGVTASCKVTVLPKGGKIAAEKVTLDKTSVEIAATKTLQLKATVTPTNATDQTITWSSSNPSVASVDKNGLVTAKKYGTATIMAETSNGKAATCKVQTRFFDVNNKKKFYYAPVYWAVDKGITVVTVNFRPEDSVTRGEFVAFLWRLAGKQKSSAKVNFKDVNSKTKFYDAIRWAVGKGIIKGYSDGTFGSDKSVTRGETATMIWRYAGKPDPKSAKSPFSDIKASKADSYKAILWGSENGIIKGSKGQFLKNDGCTRGQVVTFLYRYAEK